MINGRLLKGYCLIVTRIYIYNDQWLLLKGYCYKSRIYIYNDQWLLLKGYCL